MKTLGSIGTINACGIASIHKGKKLIATCLDTPNNIAAAFVLYPEATTVNVSGTKKSRKEYEDRFFGLDLSYHKQTIKAVN